MAAVKSPALWSGEVAEWTGTGHVFNEVLQRGHLRANCARDAIAQLVAFVPPKLIKRYRVDVDGPLRWDYWQQSMEMIRPGAVRYVWGRLDVRVWPERKPVYKQLTLGETT